MMRVPFDTDIILDVFLKREPFAEAAAALWRANEQGQVDGYVSAITPVNLFYIARKLKNVEVARRAVVEEDARHTFRARYEGDERCERR